MAFKLVMIEPKAPNLHIFSGFSLPRLGSVILGTLAHKLGWDVSVVIEEQYPIDWEEVAKADLVGVSTITSTAPRAYAVAERARKLGVPVIMGGPHVTFLPDEAMEHADFVMRGEGEAAFPLFLYEFATTHHWTKVPNLSWRKPNRDIIHNEMSADRIDLRNIPLPEWSLVKGKSLVMGGKRIVPIQTSRGCPFDCSFCSVTGMFGRKYRQRPVEHILQELRLYNDSRNFIFFYDDHFTANKSRTRELLNAMIAENFKFKFSAQLRADVARDVEMVKLLKKAGCHTVFIGFESVNPVSLESMKKQATVEDMANAAQVFDRHGIHIHGMFILGLDDDQPETIKQTVRFARKNRLSSAQFLILIPLPGTRNYEKLKAEGRITFSDWSLYDAHHVVYNPTNFSLAALQRAQVWAHAQFYSLRETTKRLFMFRFVDIGIAHYARRLNLNWIKKNKAYMKLLELLKPQKDAAIKADFRQVIDLEEAA